MVTAHRNCCHLNVFIFYTCNTAAAEHCNSNKVTGCHRNNHAATKTNMLQHNHATKSICCNIKNCWRQQKVSSADHLWRHSLLVIVKFAAFSCWCWHFRATIGCCARPLLFVWCAKILMTAHQRILQLWFSG